MGVRSHPKLCALVRQLQQDNLYNAAKYRDIRAGVDFQRNGARYEKRQEINRKRLLEARAYDETNAHIYFEKVKTLTKLF